ncbi:MAG: hypothetical protein GXO74_08820 [Calditrichaeota bacterium]|nr:hypothetical protein [Calditrichota bacterium]
MRFRAFVLMLFAMPFFGYSSQTDFKNYQRLNDFAAGQSSGISITNRGELSLAPRLSKIAASGRPFLWDAVGDARGNIFAASGDGAVLLQIFSNGKIDTIFQQPDAEIFAIAQNKKGELFAATSPDAKIYRILPNGSAKLFARLNQKYVWDLIFNEKNECFAATGDSGVIYKIDARGKFEEFYRSGDLHARSLAFDGRGNLLVGTSNQGYIYRIDSHGEGFVLYDCNYEEIRQIVTADDGTIYALVVSRKGVGAPKKFPSSEKQKSSSLTSHLDDFSFSHDAVKQSITTAIISVDNDGFAQIFWQPSVREAIYSLDYADGYLLAGTGEKGKLYRIDCADADNFSQIVQVAEPQISSIISLNERETILGTSNLLAFYRLKSKSSQKGSFESPTFDARALSQWGEIQWEKSGEIEAEFFTRSGNTGKPSQTWSSWTKLLKKGAERGQIASPRARFLQWKVRLTEKRHNGKNCIRRIRVSYRQKNFPPQITYLKVEPLGKRKTTTEKKSTSSLLMDLSALDDLDGALGKAPMPTAGAMAAKRNGYFKLSWKADDPNHDQLIFQIQIRREKEKSFWSIKKELTRKSFVWDSRTVPDGKYQIKLIASDKKQNPINLARQTARVSDWFVVDHLPPLVKNIRLEKDKGKQLRLYFTVTDDMSAIREVYISLNAEQWQWVNPQDGVSDSRREIFEIPLLQAHEKIHSLVVKALDEGENIGYGRLLIED